MTSYVSADPFDVDEFDDFIDFEDLDSGDEVPVKGGGKRQHEKRAPTPEEVDDDDDDGDEDDEDDDEEDEDDDEDSDLEEEDEFAQTEINDSVDDDGERAFESKILAADGLQDMFPELAQVVSFADTPGKYTTALLNSLIIHKHVGDDGFREYMREELAAIKARQSAISAANSSWSS